jgi:pimeloyl-ACP methyl ester carboxylesterase
MPTASRRRRIALVCVAAYGVLLCASLVMERTRSERPLAPGHEAVSVSALHGTEPTAGVVRIAYHQFSPPHPDNAPWVVLLHGSPGSGAVLQPMAPTLDQRFRVLIPDLPGFGVSSRGIPDYSMRAHAAYVIALLDRLGIERAHIVGFSMGGGVALEVMDQAPDRVQSLTMLSAIGVQEMELLGDYHVNHSLHGAQLVALWTAAYLVPHFGWFAESPLDVPYARNFYDSDQRPSATS